MNRLTAAFIVVLLGAAVGLIVLQRSEPTTGTSSYGHGAEPEKDDAQMGPGNTLTDGGSPADGGWARAGRGGNADGGPSAAERANTEEGNDAGGKLADGGAVPALNDEKPKSVIFGVVLIQYAGAQGARTGTRSYQAAKRLAQQLAELAESDFAAAVKKGDPGSAENVGRMFRTILEPAPEYVLFNLDKGEVGGPVDSPRGFYVLKRLE